MNGWLCLPILAVRARTGARGSGCPAAGSHLLAHEDGGGCGKVGLIERASHHSLSFTPHHRSPLAP